MDFVTGFSHEVKGFGRRKTKDPKKDWMALSTFFFLQISPRIFGENSIFSRILSGRVCGEKLAQPMYLAGYQFAFVLPVGFVYFGALYGIMLHPVWKLKVLESFCEK